MKKEKIKLPNVTLAAVSSVNIYETVKALKYSMKGIDFGQVVLITHKKPFALPKGITYKHCEKISDIDRFNYMMVYELAPYIDTDYMLLVHYDGFVVNPESWRDEFLEYDYIGSPWPMPTKEHCSYYDEEGNVVRVGNSVSLRSKRLLEYPAVNNLEWRRTPNGDYNEDIFLCAMNKCRMEKDGFHFAPIEVARLFGREHTMEETTGTNPFIFHKWWDENAKYPQFISPYKRIYGFLTDITRPLRNILGIHKKR